MAVLTDEQVAALEADLASRIPPGHMCEQTGCDGDNPATEVVVGGPTRQEYAAYCCLPCSQMLRS